MKYAQDRSIFRGAIMMLKQDVCSVGQTCCTVANENAFTSGEKVKYIIGFEHELDIWYLLPLCLKGCLMLEMLMIGMETTKHDTLWSAPF